ncbi:MAG TPA: hypothetical protein VHT91_01800 [Kofleriaceae bacterium]|nr:hypothetical protein [Kofleriaceae bacterium]
MRPIALSSLLVGLVACNANDPLYIQAPMTMEAGMADPMGMGLTQAKASLQLPIKTETAADKKTRDALAAKLAPIQVPYVKVGDLELDVEWTIKNLDTKPGQALIELNGASEFFVYDPSMINLAPPDAEDPPKTPGLAGDIPIDVPAGGSVSGLFTEDELREASIDLDQVTRGNVNPFRAVLTVSKNAESFQPMTAPVLNAAGEITQSPMGPPVPREAFAEMVRIDLVFKPDHHMTLDFNVRVRDLRGILDDMLLSAKPAELQMFAPMPYAPVVGPAPAP